MARYKVSDKNIYGFRDGWLQTLLLMAVSAILLALGVEFFLGPSLYRLFVADHTPALGAVGTAAGADIPIAESIADMERMDRFTLITTGTVLKYDTINDQGTIYHRLTLPSGERVVAHINRTALQETGTVGHYRLPVGCWREWEGEPPQPVTVYSATLVTTHFIDMYGENRALPAESNYSHALGGQAAVFAFFAVGLLHRFFGIRKGRFAPALLWRADPLLPRNDLECWCASTYALWSRTLPGAEGWPLLTWSHRSGKALERTRAMLAEEWGVSDARTGLEAVRRLTEPWAWNHPPADSSPGWDLCRAAQLLSLLYHRGMLERNSLDRELSQVGKLIQQRFSSWEELTESYLRGCPPRDRSRLWDALLDLRIERSGPYSLPWHTDLSWSPEGGGEREQVKQVLKHYRRAEF